ncbi:uncharacterized protein N7498_001941 [Penicillium cinerascens]|uniref:Uncharacterized protein n=1 Tax=Penicillium cinerascens TaxID=70096 RepID=A0A9W9N979_9EURO|nr:uncharacterized protein N7498_001941 [Penicillium cinerascens]KAJ5215534.1 hypothetical protein N7498_001941 [Penicillium cinerascens]
MAPPTPCLSLRRALIAHHSHIGGRRCSPLYPDEKSNASRRLGDTFTWSEALSAECSLSLGGPVSPQNRTPSRHYGHQRPASIASRDQPVQEIPKQPKQNKPGFVEKKILHGEFMD